MRCLFATSSSRPTAPPPSPSGSGCPPPRAASPVT
uniref:Uncharacterized protein n=1 Tax=Arundo donax TaxID=35708 RepID=A0A0A8ZQ29_ARUDO